MSELNIYFFGRVILCEIKAVCVTDGTSEDFRFGKPSRKAMEIRAS